VREISISSRDELFNYSIPAPDREIFKKAKEAFDRIAKPLDGLGDFETLCCRIAAIQGDIYIKTDRRAAVIFCADNGVVEEGISQSGKEVTLSVAEALGKGISSACTMGRACNVDIFPVDIGIDSDKRIDGVRDLKVTGGTGDFLKKSAMSEEETLKAISAGITMASDLKEKGYHILAAGEMGIGNTTTSTAVLSALLRIDSDTLTGRGAGIDDKGLMRKKEVIRKGIALHLPPDTEDKKERAFKILMSLGGLDIAGITGLIIGGALNRMPVVLDGLITGAAACVAETMIPGVKEYMIPSHRGREGGNMKALDFLSLTPFIEGNMALGEGTGAIMLFPLLDAAAAFYKNAGSFEDYDIDEYKRFS